MTDPSKITEQAKWLAAEIEAAPCEESCKHNKCRAAKLLLALAEEVEARREPPKQKCSWGYNCPDTCPNPFQCISCERRDRIKSARTKLDQLLGE